MGMNEIDLLLRAYYEALYEQLTRQWQDRALLTARIEKLLTEEVAKLGPGSFDKEKFDAYKDASLAFIDERIEAYNPIGIQYTFDLTARQRAIELELQLNWYDSTAEFQQLLQAARSKIAIPLTDQTLYQAVCELIAEVGAFPDESIISAYQESPALNKLPDYIVARAIEEVIRQKA